MQYSVVNYKTVRENSDFRIDAEYYHPLYLEIENKLATKKADNLNALCSKIGRNPMAYGFDYVEEGIPYFRIDDLYDPIIDYSNIVFISENIHQTLKSTQLLYGDIVMGVRGTIGKLGIYRGKNYKANISPNTIFFRPKNKNLSSFLSIYFLSKFGLNQIQRITAGTVQPTITSFLLKQIKVFKPSNNFLDLCNKLVDSIFDTYKNSKTLYTQAEQLLLAELGLLDWKPKHTLTFIKNYSDTQKAERIDAEYFQPKYEEIIEAVKNYKGGFDELGNLVKIKDKNFTPKEKEQYKYIELANISSNGEINGYTENYGNELPSRARRKVQKSDLIISSIEGSLESIALITEDWKNALCSTGFFVVNSDQINPETLLVLLKTKVGQLQLKKGCKGTILTAIDKNELLKIVLPKIDLKTQKEIKDKIIEMYETKKLSKSLLEIAKRGVDIAIEKDEQAAEKWIMSEVFKLGVII